MTPPLKGPQTDDGDCTVEVAVLQTDIKYIKDGIDGIKKQLEKGDERMNSLDTRVTALEAQNSLIGKLSSAGMLIIAAFVGVAGGHYWK